MSSFGLVRPRSASFGSVLAIGLASFAAFGAAQPDPFPDRTSYVYHVYVDPLFGDNTRATADNPPPAMTAGTVQALGLHTEPGTPKPINGVLQHAPFAFRTLTGVTGALAYVAPFLPKIGLSGLTEFYTIDIDPGPNSYLVSIRHVVIHCLPGLYGPVGEGLPVIDPDSGVPYNGETWPAVIPDFLSLQGTSALDTIFDARLQETAIVFVQGYATSFLDTHRESFIDSLTIRRARCGPTFSRGAGAGIYVNSSLTRIPTYVTVSNCVITDNLVGVAFDSWNGTENRTPQRGRMVNNTVAWNGIGVWAGDTGLPGSASIHELFLINNIFDSGSPPGPYVAGLSGFEGVRSDDKQVDLRGTTTMNVDFNAWEDAPAKVNLSAFILPNWPVTLAASTAPWVGPKVNIRPYTLGSTGRGVLYLNDAFRVSPAGGAGVDYSPHDFRLAPMVTTDPTDPPGNQTPEPRNPLVGEGVDGTEGGGGSFLMIRTFSGQSITDPPGLPPGSEEVRVDGWDWDTEGFGNPRIQHRTGFANTNPYGDLDIGADEMGNLIMAGFVNGTRILSEGYIPNAYGVPNHFDVYFFDLLSLGARSRPDTNMYAGAYVSWWVHVQSAPDAPVAGENYTNVAWDLTQNPLAIPERLADITYTGSPYERIMRNRRCDFSPHLQPDWHPFWGPWIEPPAPGYRGDVYAANPWFDHAAPPAWGIPLITRDNPALFHNLGADISNRWFLQTVFVTEAHLNPPGTFLQPARFTLAPTTTFGPYVPCTGSSSTSYKVGLWGYGDSAAGCPDRIPFIGHESGYGVRFNCEVLVNGATTTNLQTFLGIWNSDFGESASPGGQVASRSRATAPRSPTQVEVGDVVRQSIELRRSR